MYITMNQVSVIEADDEVPPALTKLFQGIRKKERALEREIAARPGYRRVRAEFMEAIRQKRERKGKTGSISPRD